VELNRKQELLIEMLKGQSKQTHDEKGEGVFKFVSHVSAF
jgi:hypothetical protein